MGLMSCLVEDYDFLQLRIRHNHKRQFIVNVAENQSGINSLF